MARYAVPTGKALVSNEITHASNSDTTMLSSRAANLNSSPQNRAALPSIGLPSIGIGVPLESSESASRKRTFADSTPQSCEIFWLVCLRALFQASRSVDG